MKFCRFGISICSVLGGLTDDWSSVGILNSAVWAVCLESFMLGGFCYIILWFCGTTLSVLAIYSIAPRIPPGRVEESCDRGSRVAKIRDLGSFAIAYV